MKSKTLFGMLVIIVWSASPIFSQEAVERIDNEMITKIKEEGTERSEVMDTISYLTDVYGPRLTGSPMTEVAGNWTVKRLEGWGLENCTLEEWGPFGRGWTLEGCVVNMVEPNYSPLIAHVKAWSPSTTRMVRATPIYMDAATMEDLEQYRGKLGRAIVLISPPRDLAAHFEPEASRKDDADLLRLANAGAPGQGGRMGGRSRGRGAAGSGAANGAPGRAGTTPAEIARGAAADPRAAQQVQAAKWDMAYNEGAAVILEPGRGDGGNVFVAGVTMPRKSSDQGEVGNRFSRGPRPWAAEPGEVIPQLVMSAEHYNRLVRMIQRGAKPELEIDVLTKFYNDNPNSFNVIAEISGTDLKDEIVMLGAHFDSWQSGTGATDNAVGCGVAMEAVRILKAIGVKPRRTIRLALWTGEEQGLLGSRAYVEQHFGKRVLPESGSSEGEQPQVTYEVTPEQEKISAYYNLDNGTGKIRGIYLQGNEQLRGMFRSWLAAFSEMDASTITSGNTGGTDHQSFDAVGIPGFQFIQDEVEYNSRTHHSSMDVFDRIQEDDVKQASIIMAAFVYNTAMRDEKLARKTLKGEVVVMEANTVAAEPEVIVEQPEVSEAKESENKPAEAAGVGG